MKDKKQRPRWLAERIPGSDQRRIVVITGARQVGKTTLARRHYPRLRYLNLDNLETRASLPETRTQAWGRTVGPAIMDEAQKEPTVFDKVKYSFDSGDLSFSVLLGSSRFLLLRKIRETLAGRAFLYDLWPLMLSELAAKAGQATERPLLDALLRQDGKVDSLLKSQPEALLGEEEERRRAALDHLSLWGGMPALLPLSEQDRKDWLRSYQITFLERDLADLVQLTDLRPFRTLQQLAMLRTGQLVNFTELGRDAGMSAPTVQSYLEYLDISYQILFLRPYHSNLTSTLVKSPKLFWTDVGLLRQGTGQWGPLTGAQFETLVIMEAHKWIKTMLPDARMYSYRTRSKRELDLLIEIGGRLLGIEVKKRSKIVQADARTLRAVAEAVGNRWMGGLVVSTGSHVQPLVAEHSIWTVPAHRLF